MNAMKSRTNASSLAFFSRSSILDTFEPRYICTPEAENFCQDVLGHNLFEICRLFEQWCCAKSKGMISVTIGSIFTEC